MSIGVEGWLGLHPTAAGWWIESMPSLGPGVLYPHCPLAGSYFPQFAGVPGALLDDQLDPGAWLMARSLHGVSESTGGLRCVVTNDPALVPVCQPIEHWLAKHNAEAVLVRQDHYVFGVGAPDALARAWREALA